MSVTYLGNPEPHAPLTKDGMVVGRLRSREIEGVETPYEGSVSIFHWQPDVEEALVEHQEGVLATSRESLLNRLLLDEKLESWEIAAGHVLRATGAHAAAGMSWVAADDPLQTVLAHLLDAAPAPEGTASVLALAAVEGESWDEILAGLQGPTALKTEKGIEVIAGASFGTSAQPAAMNYVALTANTEAPKATSTTLTGEITTSGGGLLRKQVTYGFTLATGVATLTGTFTANSSDSLPVEVAKFGVFNKVTSGGTLGIETKLSSTVPFKVEGDNMTLTETLTIT